MLKNTVQRRRPPIWRMRIAYWIPNATNTHTGYVTLIAFPQQQRLHELVSVLLSACLVPFKSRCFQIIYRFPRAPSPPHFVHVCFVSNSVDVLQPICRVCSSHSSFVAL
jgi:hypothetical protein